jgi:hypothetical protein
VHAMIGSCVGESDVVGAPARVGEGEQRGHADDMVLYLHQSCEASGNEWIGRALFNLDNYSQLTRHKHHKTPIRRFCVVWVVAVGWLCL